MDATELGIVEESAGTDDHREAAGIKEKFGPKERPKISLYKAVWDNRIDVVKEYIDNFRNKDIWEQNDEDPNRLDANGFAPVHYAAKFNHFEIMKMLIEAEDAEDLEFHSLEETEGSLQNHLRSGSVAEHESRGSKWTPLHFAACYQPYYERKDAVKEELAKKEEEEEEDKEERPYSTAHEHPRSRSHEQPRSHSPPRPPKKETPPHSDSPPPSPPHSDSPPQPESPPPSPPQSDSPPQPDLSPQRDSPPHSDSPPQPESSPPSPPQSELPPQLDLFPRRDSPPHPPSPSCRRRSWASTSTSKRAVHYLIKKCKVNVNARAVDRSTPLHLACQHGNVAAVDLLLASDRIQVNATDLAGDTPLHKACLSGETAIAEKILAKMKKTNRIKQVLYNHADLTPMHIACREGHAKIVDLFLRFGFDLSSTAKTVDFFGFDLSSTPGPDIGSNYSTPLHLACESGKEQIVAMLVCKGADVLSEREGKITAVHIAAKHGYIKVMKELLKSKRGRSILKTVDMNEQTPLHYAARNNRAEMIKYLLDKGADIDDTDANAYTPIMIAAANGNISAFLVLRDRGARLDRFDRDGKSIICLVVEADHVPILKELVKNSSSAQLSAPVDAQNNTPLHIAAERGHLDTVRLLVEQTFDTTSAKNSKGKTPMHLAAKCGHISVVEELFNRSVDTINSKDANSDTPLHLACTAGSYKVAKFIIESQVADIEARNSRGRTPMACAANRGHTKVIELLISAKARVNCMDNNDIQHTPLHLAARMGHHEAVSVLLSNNADVSAVNWEGENPLDVAIECGHKEVVQVILNNPDQWRKALRNTTYHKFGGQPTTPLRRLIRKMPDVAKQVLNQCCDHFADIAEYNYEFLEDFRTKKRNWNVRHRRVKKHSADPKEWGPVGFDKSNHLLSVMVESEQLDLLKHPLVDSLINHKWRAYGRKFFYGDLINFLVFLIFLTTFALVLPNPLSATCQESFNIANNPNAMIVVNDVDILSANFAPFEEFLNSSGTEILNNTASISGELVCRADSIIRDELAGLRPALALISDEGNGTFTGSVQCGDCGIRGSTAAFIRVAAAIIILISFLRLGLKIFQFVRLLGTLDYVRDLVNWMEVVLYMCSILFAFVFFTPCNCPLEWQWQVGVVAVFLTWIDLIHYLGKNSLTGIYILMFVDIFYTFWKLIILTALLVIAFSLSFYMVFNEPGILFSRSPFADPARSILKTMTMITGELDFDAIFKQTPGGVLTADDVPGQVPFPEVSYMLWIIFLILMPILLSNLLVGLAVDDIKGILEAAALSRIALKVDLILNIEALMPDQLHAMYIHKYHKQYLSHKSDRWEQFMYWLRKENKEDFRVAENLKSALDRYKQDSSAYAKTPDTKEEHTSEIIRQLAKMQETLNSLSQRLDNIDRRYTKPHHTGHEVHASEGRHRHHDLEGSSEEGDGGESVSSINLEEGEGEELEQLNGPAEEEVTVAEAVL